MDRSIFSRYKRNKRELVLLEKAIEKLENRLEDVPIVNGKVSGSSKNFPYIETHMTVQMAEPKAADEISKKFSVCFIWMGFRKGRLQIVLAIRKRGYHRS